MIRNLIFDWSGTLVDDLPAVWAATNHVLRRAGKPELSLAEFRAEFCLPFTGFYDRHVPDVPLPQLEVWFHTCFQQVQDSVVALPHAVEFLQLCRQRGWRTCVLSTVRADHYARQAERTGLGRFIDTACVGVRDKRRRIHALLAENGFSPGETLLVGDMQHDIETARYGGVCACAVLTGYNTAEQLRAAGPDIIVQHLGELRDRLGTEDFSTLGNESRAAGRGTPRVEVRGLVFDSSDRVLLLRGPGPPENWDTPGGAATPGESWPDALRRLLKQQAGLEVSDPAFVQVQEDLAMPQADRDGQRVLIDYTCRCVACGPADAQRQNALMSWATLTEATALPLTRHARALLEAVATQ